MGTLSVTQTDRLYWLGRYIERVKATLDVSSDLQERLLDGTMGYDYASLCEKLAIPNIYDDVDDFIDRFLFDEDNPDSIVSNMNRAFDNAIVMRDVLHSTTLSYIQLALNTLLAGRTSPSPMLELQETLDYIYAFWGAVEDLVIDINARYALRTGSSVERIDLCLRLRMNEGRLTREVPRLVNRLYRSGIHYDAACLQELAEHFEFDTWREHAPKMLEDIENLVQIY